MTKREITILGELWTVKICKQSEDQYLRTCDGYTDKTLRTICILAEDRDLTGETVSDFKAYMNKVLRHEVIHAFLFESGLDGYACEETETGHPEMLIDWFAIQYPKIRYVYNLLECGGGYKSRANTDPDIPVDG